MRPDSTLLVAVCIAACAFLAAGGAVVIARVADRRRTGLIRRRAAIRRAAVAITRDATDIRDRMWRTVAASERMRADGASWDEQFERLTASLGTQRAGIERLTRGRLARIIRLAGMLSRAAQFALLWR